ncbi:hypothetical protein B0T16DRAFT_383824 [Cercophora newfieldiana]|uniref:Mg2+ transporter protein, CorA-like/Zinc transport protein ZntB n=1 Tax=Cercophora newfieldiana TaxID=92897 RepID=A0AA39YLI5_9PEZI|nr:hypothetical protein B0T16DRAFT_383824 [Cercophora newfieldiana]
MATERLPAQASGSGTGPDLAGWLEHVEAEAGPSGSGENAPEDHDDGEPDQRQTPSPSDETDYITSFKSRKHLMPHWRNVLMETRNPSSGSISVLTFRKQAGPVPRIPAAIPPRAVLVTDLSEALINALGPQFGLSPEIFEEHLVQSGYTKTSYDDPDPSTWQTRFLKRQHFSLRWYSMVLRNDVEPRDDRLRELLIQEKLVWRGSVQSRGPGKAPIRKKRFLYTPFNIFRREWPLSSMSRTPKQRLVKSPDQRGLVDLEEGDEDDFAHEWNPGMRDPDDDDYNVVAWEERVTFCWGHWDSGDLKSVKIPILLLDPLPKMKLMTGVGATAQTLNVMPFSRRLAPRGPPPVLQLTNDPAALDLLNSYTNKATRAAFGVHEWLNHIAATKVLAGNHSAIDMLLLAVFQMIRQDTIVFLRHVGNILDEISTGSTDERMMQEQLGHWRSLLGRLQSEFPVFERSLGEFFAFPYQGDNGQGAPPPPQLTASLQQLREEISAMNQRSQRTRESLLAEMSLLESKRGIEEAESVARLTELAFIFIPMTFAAALFSMQVKELADDPPPLYGFVIAAVIALAISYGLRLVQRSTVVAEARRKWEDEIRSEGQITSRVLPVRKVTIWLARKLSAKLLIVLIACAAVVLLLVPIWTREAMDTSFRGAVTAFSLLCLVSVAVYAIYNWSTTGIVSIPNRGSGVLGFGRIWREPDEDEGARGERPPDGSEVPGDGGGQQRPGSENHV